MFLIDIHAKAIGSYLSELGSDSIRKMALSGVELTTVRLDLFIEKQCVNYGYTSVSFLNSDLIEELAKCIDGNDHYFQLDGYDLLPLKLSGQSYRTTLSLEDGGIFHFYLDRLQLMKELVRCLRCTSDVIDALQISL